jgi:hypothetical protein
MKHLSPLLALTLSLFTPFRFAEAQTPTTNSPGFSLTIYSTADPATFDPQDYVRQQTLNTYYAQQNPLPGYGVVRENRAIDLQKGETDVRFTDVATGIDPTTVSFESLDPKLPAAVLEQNYEYDLVSADKLLGKYVGKGINIIRQTPGVTGSETITGTLLSFDPSTLVVQGEHGDIRVLSRGSDIQSINLASSDASLITKPTLVWKIQSDSAGKPLAQVTYQTDGLTWRADYNVSVNTDDTAADIGAWVTILNQSGAGYPDSKLKLVAGDVQRIKPAQPFYGGMRLRQAAAAEMQVPQFAEKSFFEYHLYTLDRTTSLSNNSTKQIELFSPKLDVPITKEYVYYGLPEQFRFINYDNPNMDQNLGVDSNKKVDVYLQLTNSEKNGLGIPLPAGRIRVYKTDEADGSKEFIGEDVIQHTPKDENVMMKLGSAFDIVGERKQTAFNVNYNGHELTESFEIKLRNHKKEPVHVIVKENLFRWVNWDITQSSDKWEKQDYRTIHIPVDVPVDGEKTVTYTVKYTW